MLARFRVALLFAALLFATGHANAWQPPKVQYSADSHMETSEAVMDGMVYYAPGKERREFVQDGDKTVMILRHDKKKMWMLMPEEKMYMETSMAKARMDDLSAYKITQTRVGPETVNGVKTTKYKLIMIGSNGHKMGGFFWVTKDDIVVKMDAISVDKQGKERIKIDLKNLKVGKQDPALFEVPAGYSSGMPGLGSMMGGGGEKEPPKSSQDEGKKKSGGFGLGDALKLLR